jgi:sec-independent protein translocase protein TatB
MFDIGFTELVLIAVVALVVLGPERLPKAARTMGHLFGRLQRYVNEVKADINREMELEELRKLQRDVQGAAREFETSMASVAQEVESGVRGVESELNAAAAEVTKDAAATPPEPGRLYEPRPNALPPPEPAAAGDVEPPRQATLPGLDRI